MPTDHKRHEMQVEPEGGVKIPGWAYLLGLALLSGTTTWQATDDPLTGAVVALSTFLGVGGGYHGVRRIRRRP